MTITSYKSQALVVFLSLVSPMDAWLSTSSSTGSIRRRAFAPSISTSTGTGTSTASNTALRAAPSSEVDPMEQMRLRLEMHWELEESKQECHVEDPSTCGGEVCDSCGGHGEISCRFCRGTGQLYMKTKMEDGTYESGFCSCPICSHTGHETCQKCKGTGWVAHWTTHGESIGGTSSLKP